MRLIGRNLSPYARRVAIWCALQGRALERSEWAPVDPAIKDDLSRMNPVLRVPALELDDGSCLIETFAICDWLDETGPHRLVPASGIERRDTLQRIAVATSTTEKVVALVYETNRRPPEFHFPQWRDRLIEQIRGGLAAMEAKAPAKFFGGDSPDGSDIATVCAYQMAEVTNPFLLEPGYPKLAALAERAMALAPFADTKPQM
ncbi:MAG: glutathione S-transferase family protein [Pseudomonadota bacterium]